MNKFSDFGIKSTTMLGDKIKIEQVLNKLVYVIDFKVEKSKYPKGDNDKCLHLQIKNSGNNNVVFTSSNVLIDTIEQIPKDKFPFETTIVKSGKYYEFT